MALAYLLGKTRGWAVQTLAGVSLFDHAWVIWWLPPGWSKILGGVRAELDDFEAAIAQKTILLYAPEGLHGPRKGWLNRYQLQTFHPSFINLSDRYQIPILPVLCLGNEYLHPWTIHLKKIARRFSLPFLPISPLMFVFILFPSMGVWAMKTRLRYSIQPFYQSGSEENNRTNAYQKAQELREKMQTIINSLRKGKKEVNL
jgi:1-acyl-sn-glycerol-3-phosphate acyltransferase